MNTLSILNTVSARQLQRDYKSIFANVNKTNTPIMVISNNEPQVVILSIKEMDNINKFFSKQKFWEAVREIQSKNRYNDPITTQKDIDQAVEDAKQYVYDKTFGSARHKRIRQRPPTTAKHTRKDNPILVQSKLQNNYLWSCNLRTNSSLF